MLFSHYVSSGLSMLSQRSQDWIDSTFTSANAMQCSACCDALQDTLGSRVWFPGSKVYKKSLSSWWSALEQELHPKCIVSPSNAQDVSKAVSILVKSGKNPSSKCKFAVKGGGHTPFAGSSNIENGVTIDLGSLNDAVLSNDKKTVVIGPGARWVDVYNSLIPHGLITSGGRVASVGVGGLTLGGGISFFTPRYGFVCDNVNSFQVVTSSGKIINANAKENSDLWVALRGGSNNFGIVTSIKMRTFEQGDFWGGFTINPIGTRMKQFELFANFTKSAHYDQYSSLINSYVYDAATGAWFIANNLEYTKSNPPEPNPPVFQPFTALKQTVNTMRVSNLSDFTNEIAGQTPPGLRDIFATATFANDARMVQKFFMLTNSSAHRLKEVRGLQLSVSFQPFSKAVTLRGAANGGNSLGISEKDGDMFNALVTAMWNDTRHDAAIRHEVRNLFAEAEQAARDMGVYREYLYLNYADKWQDPIKGYGKDIVKQLRKVSRKYDPEQVFQKQVPGGFKLGS